MGLSVRFVESLDQVVEPVIEHLNDRQGRDLFEMDHIVVPNAGVRAWLLQQLAYSIGASNTNDGVIAGVNVGYLGMVQSIAGGVTEADDPWGIDPLTMAVLECLPTMANYTELRSRYNGPLRAARTIADRLDRYHAHRPQMIEAWESGRAELMVELGERTTGGEWMQNRVPLAPRDHWQFELWTKVRQIIGVPSPPAQLVELARQLRLGEVSPTASRVMIAGIQSMPARMVSLLQALAARIPIEVVMVHPSPALHASWSRDASELSGAAGVLPLRQRDVIDQTIGDSLFVNWLQGSRDAQMVLGAHGVFPEFVGRPHAPSATGLLGHIQQSIVSSPELERGTFIERDHSVQIHRAHELSRQVEILHDALLRAFSEVEGLRPHDVVILCPDMATVAPLLAAVFDRDVEVLDKDGATRSVRIPLVVADRGLRQVSDGTQVLSQMLSVVTSRASKVSVLGLLCSPAVLRANGLSGDVVDLWWKIVDRTGVNWGLTEGHRARRDADAVLGRVQSWAGGIEQALTGVMLPDAEARPEVGGIVPLDDLDTADFPAVAALVHLVGILSALEAETGRPRSVREWTDIVESALVDLCGTAGDLLAEPTGILRDLRRAASSRPGSDVRLVEFGEFAGLVIERAEEIPGRQPLRTGAVTATSMVPLRSVPFKVVCVLGYDESATGSYESESDDLSVRQQFLGDVDPRIDGRRAFLDAVLAAGEQFIVICNGRSSKNNAKVPFVTPLAEFVDMCVRAGGAHDSEEQTWSFVFDHPRHAIGASNFIPDKIIPDSVFSHSVRDKDSSLTSGVLQPVASHPVVPVPADDLHEITVRNLIEVVRRPHNFFLATLGIPKWREEPEPDTAVLPLDVSALTTSILWRERCVLGAAWNPTVRKNHIGVLQQRGQIPVGVMGEENVDDINDIFSQIINEAHKWDEGFTGSESMTVEFTVDGVDITGDVACSRAGGRLILITYKSPAELNHEAALALLLLEAQGIHCDEAILIGWENEAVRTKQLTWKEPLTIGTAETRLTALVNAVRAATTLPMFAFGKTADLVMDGASWTDVREAFGKFVSDHKFENSPEVKVFGEEPAFDDVFPENGLLHAAWKTRRDGLREVKNIGGKAPVHVFVNEQVARSVAQ